MSFEMAPAGASPGDFSFRSRAWERNSERIAKLAFHRRSKSADPALQYSISKKNNIDCTPYPSRLIHSRGVNEVLPHIENSDIEEYVVELPVKYPEAGFKQSQLSRNEVYAPIELEVKNNNQEKHVSREELVGIFQDSLLGDIVSVQCDGLTSAIEQIKSSRDLARGKLSIRKQLPEGGWVECFPKKNCSDTHTVNVSPKSVDDLHTEIDVEGADPTPGYPVKPEEGSKDTPSMSVEHDPKNSGFLDAAEGLAPGIEPVIRLLLCQDLMNPFYLWLKNHMGIGLTHSGKGDVGYKQDLACFDADHCCFSAEVHYDQVADSRGGKVGIPTSKIRLVVFLQKNDSLWKPVKLEIQYDLYVKGKKGKKIFGRKKNKINKKQEVGVSHSNHEIKKPNKVLHKRSHSMDEHANCRVMPSPKKNYAQWIGDGLFLTNLSQSRMKEFVAVEASLIEYEKLLESKMMAQKLADDSVESVIIPHGYQIADRLSMLHKYYPSGVEFPQWLDSIRNKYPTLFQEFESKLVSESKILWERTFKIASEDYEGHRYNDDLTQLGGEVSFNSPKSKFLELFDEIEAFIHDPRKANISIRRLVKELKDFESQVSGSQDTDVMDVLWTVARIKCDVVKAVKSYREPDGKSHGVPQETAGIPQSIKDVVGLINLDSTAGSKLCDLWIKKTFAAIEQKAELDNEPWFVEVCRIIEAVNSGNNNYEQLAGKLEAYYPSEFGTLV